MGEVSLGETILILIQFPNRKNQYFDMEKTVKQPDRPYLTSEEVADLLGVSIRTVTLWFNQWCETRGQEGLPGFKVGRSWRADRQEIDTWIAKQKVRLIQANEPLLRQVR